MAPQQQNEVCRFSLLMHCSNNVTFGCCSAECRHAKCRAAKASVTKKKRELKYRRQFSSKETSTWRRWRKKWV